MAPGWLRDCEVLPLIHQYGATRIFSFKLEAEIPLLTVTQTGVWSVVTVLAFEPALRHELVLLQVSGRPRSLIIDIKSSLGRRRDVTEALSAMVARFGPLHPERTAIVSSLGFAKLEAGRVRDVNAQVFTSMAHARDWVMGKVYAQQPAGMVHDEPSDARPEGLTVHVHGPSDVNVVLTPAAALETARRISDAAVEVLLETAKIVCSDKADGTGVV